jgi:hypothetical protein
MVDGTLLTRKRLHGSGSGQPSVKRSDRDGHQ